MTLAYSRQNQGGEDMFTWAGENPVPRVGGNGDQSRPSWAGMSLVFFTNERGDDKWDIAVSEAAGQKRTLAKDVRLPLRADTLRIMATGLLLSGALDQRAADFLASEQGAQLLSLTGRDRIWAAALEEWRLHQVFGYGLSLWDAEYRNAIGLPHATHAHNQWLDDAARAGSVGVATLIVYSFTLMALCLRHARASGGLALALGLTLALRAVGEVPLSLLGYGTELFVHLLLVATLAAAVYPRETAAADTITEDSLTEPARAGRGTRSGRLAGLAPKGRAAPGIQAAPAATPSPWGRRA
jgi:hypothetical protein